jgi:hypothetical protein
MKTNNKPLVFHSIGNGSIAIGHKPGGKISYDLLKQHGITTGMITYGLLRFLGNDVITSHQILLKLRQVTSEQVGEARLKWGDIF